MDHRRRAFPFLISGGGYQKYSIADGNPASLPDIEYEQLLKAADDLDNWTYWTTNSLVLTDQGDGSWKIERLDGTNRYHQQTMTNWFPEWAGVISFVFEVRAGTLDAIGFSIQVDGSASHISGEKISGTGTFTYYASSHCTLTGLDSNWTKVRISSNVKGWATSIGITRYPGYSGPANPGYMYLRNCQVILGDQPDEKPRPTQASVNDWMMAYRPHNRLTADGNRYSVADTEGLVWCGECYDIRISPATAWSCPADTIAHVYFTAENSQYFIIRGRTEGSTDYGWELYVTSGNIVVRDYYGGSQHTLDTYSSVITDTEFCRIRIEVSGTSLLLYLDDEYLGTSTIPNNPTVAAGSFGHNYATNDIKIVSETYPKKSTGIIFAGGLATPAYGDPGVWLTTSAGSTFSVGEGDAVFFTGTPKVTNGVFTAGWDSNTASTLADPNMKYLNAELKIDIGATDETPVTWTAGTEKSFLAMLRSDDYGQAFFVHGSGSQWQRFNVNTAAIPAASAYPGLSNYTAAMYITQFALLDLSPKHTAEWVEQLAYQATPVTNTAYDLSEATATLHVHCDITRPDPLAGSNCIGLRTDAQTLFQAGSTNGGDDALLYDVINATYLISTNNNKLAAGGTYHQEVVLSDDGYIYLFVDKKLVGSAVIPTNWTVPNKVWNYHSDTGENITNLVVNRYPALGGQLGATDRVVCAQDNDQMTTANDCFVYLREYDNTSNQGYFYRLITAFQEGLYTQINNDGSYTLYEYIGGGANNRGGAGAGAWNADEDLFLILDGTSFKMGADGVIDVNQTDVITNHVSGTLAEFTSGTAHTMAAAEAWPLYVKIFKP